MRGALEFLGQVQPEHARSLTGSGDLQRPGALMSGETVSAPGLTGGQQAPRLTKMFALLLISAKHLNEGSFRPKSERICIGRTLRLRVGQARLGSLFSMREAAGWRVKEETLDAPRWRIDWDGLLASGLRPQIDGLSNAGPSQAI